MTIDTTNIGLKKIDTSLNADGTLKDGTLDFNIDTLLNDNWDKIDTAIAEKLSSTDTTVTKKGNSFNGASQLVLLDADGKLPAIDGGNLTNIGGALKLNALGTIINGVTLPTNSLTTAYVNATIAIALPTNLVSGVENTVVFDFTTSSSSQPTISTSGTLKWSDKNSGNAPSAYSTLSGVRNRLIFKTNDGGTTWEAEYTNYGITYQPFIMPVLAGNGTLGGTTAAVSASAQSGYEAYKACDGNSSTYFWSSIAVPVPFIYYNPKPFSITNLFITNSGTQNYYTTAFSVYRSNDGVTWTLQGNYTNSVTAATQFATAINETVSQAKKYVKIVSTSGYNGGSNWSFSDISFSGYELTS